MKMKNNKKKKGFTLIELIVVIAILAILAAVAVPNFIGLTAKATIATEVAAAAEYANAINITNTMDAGTITADSTTAQIISAINDANLTPNTEVEPADAIRRITVGADGVAKVTSKGVYSAPVA